ncbi:hypothetical protein JW964_14060 [candidate division KSB1 bacterium]|nr:hypothetical protein [candidate division KSB1 bacterium]
MWKKIGWPFIIVSSFLLFTFCQPKPPRSVTVPVELDHNRMLITAEIQRKDGSWRKARLWVDSGNPEFFLSESLARDLGIELDSVSTKTTTGSFDVPPPTGVRINGMQLNFSDAKSKVMFQPQWLFSTMHNDANLPSTVLNHYQVVFDYPQLQLTIAEPGNLQLKGNRVPIDVHPETGIIQMDVVIAGDSLSFALDNGASYSFVSDEVIERLVSRNLAWPQITGTLGCANMWGWWPPNGETLPVLRIPEILAEPIHFYEVGMVGVPKFSPNGPSLGEWYSHKTARPVHGFLGVNALKVFRISIDYRNQAAFFEQDQPCDVHDMDLVGLTLRPEPDGGYRITGIAKLDGKSAVDGVLPGDLLRQVDQLQVTHATMGAVVDALRGNPGDSHLLLLERDGKQFTIFAKVERFL